ncbi:GvpL/GvpF family gas vesicle protein [Actinomycetospora atypica]
MSGEANMDTTTEEQPAATTEAVGSYVYGIVPAGTRLPEDLEPVPHDGEEGLGLVTSGRVAAVVSDVATDRPLGTRKDLTAHERVLNALAQNSAVLPMRFGAVVADDDAVADELLAPHEDYFVRALEQMTGLTQFNLRGDYVQEAVLARIVQEDPEIDRLRRQIAGVDEDAAYYDRIKLGEAISHAFDSLRQQDADATLDALERFAVSTVVKEAGGENGAVHVAFLVREDHRTDFERAVDDLGDAWEGRVTLRLVGPTAAFDFLPEYEAPDGGDG